MTEVLERWQGQRVKGALWEMANAASETTKKTKQIQILSAAFYTRHTGIQQLLHCRCTKNLAQLKHCV